MPSLKQSKAIPLDKPKENSNAFSLEGASPSSEGDSVVVGIIVNDRNSHDVSGEVTMHCIDDDA